MTYTRLSLVAVFVGLAAVPVAAQDATIIDSNSPRWSAFVGYGGHGFDLEAAVDSRMLGDRYRLRGSIGHGRWDDVGEEAPTPRMSRVSLSLLKFSSRHDDPRTYLGVGYTWLLPRGPFVGAYQGLHVTAGIEGKGTRWTFGPEVAVDLPFGRRPYSDAHPQLCGTARIGITIHRRR